MLVDCLLLYMICIVGFSVVYCVDVVFWSLAAIRDLVVGVGCVALFGLCLFLG